MEEKILNLSKSLVKIIIHHMSNEDTLLKKPSVSYITEVLISFPMSLSILSDIKGEALLRTIFTTYNLLSGDSEEMALNKTKDLFYLDIKTADYSTINDYDEIEIKYITILSQGHDFVQSIRRNHNRITDEIEGFDTILEDNIGDILIVDIFKDIVDISEWGDDSDMDVKLEFIGQNIGDLHVSEKKKRVTFLPN